MKGSLRAVMVGALVLSLAMAQSRAENWVNGAAEKPYNWSDPVNWDPAVPNAVDAVAVFGTPAQKPNGQINIDTNIKVGSIHIYESYWGPFPPSYFQGGGGTLTFEVSTGNALIDVSALNGATWPNAVTFNQNVAVASDLDIASATALEGGSMWVFAFASGKGLSGTGAINVTSGRLSISGGNDLGYTGDITLASNTTLFCDSPAALGAGLILMDTNAVLGFSGSLTERALVLLSDARLVHGSTSAGSITTVISGGGQLTIDKGGRGNEDRAVSIGGNEPNTYTGGTVIRGSASVDINVTATSYLGAVVASKPGAFGAGNITLQGQTWLMIATNDVINDAALLIIDGDPSAPISEHTDDGPFLLDMETDEKVGGFVVNGVAMVDGTYGRTGSGATYTGVNAQLDFDLDLLFNDSFDNGGTAILTVGTPPPPGTVLVVE